jgi:glutathione S-transferase
LKLVDAARCPYCARVRIALAEKGLAFETVEVDLANRPQWLLDLNPPRGRVPVLDELPESEVIMEYLEEQYPERPLFPDDLRERARARFLVNRFDERLGDDYYAFRRGEPNELAARLEELEVGQSLYADIAYVPWVIRARDMLGVELPQRIADWLAALEQRPAVAAEVATVRAL